jgi:enoyl-CoA hydratase/carnithine racemase
VTSDESAPATYERDGHVATITYNRPERLNAINGPMRAALNEAWQAFLADDDAWVAIVTGAGRAFCAGADMREGGSIGEFPGSFFEMPTVNSFESGLEVWKPTVAAVGGYCLGYGLTAVAACDFVIAADDAQFGTPEVNVGLWPYMITVPLLRSMPPKKVLELQMTGRRVHADEADRIGFVTRVVPVAELDAAVEELAGSLAAKSPLVLRWGRDAFYRVLEMDGDAALDHLQAMLTVHTQSEDAAEGVAAFAEKRTPEWKGR